MVLSAMLFSFTCISAQTAFSAKKISQLPKGIKTRGTLTEAWQWNDKLGENILVLSVLGPYAVKIKDAEDEEAHTIELFATHYYKKDSAYKTLWRLNDLVKECNLDYTAEFIRGSTTITDLDKDGIAETLVQYKLACHGDVSPSYMKLVMHKDSVKYALRGSMWLDGAVAEAKFAVTENNANLEKLPRSKKGDDEQGYVNSMGRYETEKEFAKAPPVFLQHARRQWIRYAKESFE